MIEKPNMFKFKRTKETQETKQNKKDISEYEKIIETVSVQTSLKKI